MDDATNDMQNWFVLACSFFISGTYDAFLDINEFTISI